MSANPIYETDFYVQVQRRRRAWRNGSYRGPISVAKLSQDPPEQLLPDAVLVKLHLRIPAAAFEPLTPAATVDIPIGDVARQVQVDSGPAPQLETEEQA